MCTCGLKYICYKKECKNIIYTYVIIEGSFTVVYVCCSKFISTVNTGQVYRCVTFLFVNVDSLFYIPGEADRLSPKLQHKVFVFTFKKTCWLFHT